MLKKITLKHKYKLMNSKLEYDTCIIYIGRLWMLYICIHTILFRNTSKKMSAHSFLHIKFQSLVHHHQFHYLQQEKKSIFGIRLSDLSSIALNGKRLDR